MRALRQQDHSQIELDLLELMLLLTPADPLNLTIPNVLVHLNGRSDSDGNADAAARLLW